jgi:hypothetical protein
MSLLADGGQARGFRTFLKFASSSCVRLGRHYELHNGQALLVAALLLAELVNL